MSWKFVFNPEGVPVRTLEQIAVTAQEAGYEFFVANGVVYSITPVGYFETRIKSSDLF